MTNFKMTPQNDKHNDNVKCTLQNDTLQVDAF
jgi:hypothetical protein